MKRWKSAEFGTNVYHRSPRQDHSQGPTRHARGADGGRPSDERRPEYAGPIEFARIATLRAINRHVERVFDTSRKDKHWGRRKLARDR
jgi:hypothetical protein